MYKRFIQGKKAVFFDLDGTVIDSVTIWAWAFSQVLAQAKWDITLETAQFGLAGESLDDKWKRFLGLNLVQDPPEVKVLTQKTEAYFIKFIEANGIEAREGFWDFLYEIKEDKKFVTALVTNSSSLAAKIAIESANLEKVFDLIIYGDDVKHRKPNPEIYLKAAKQLKLNRRDILVFEDSLIGAQSSVNAKMSTIVIWDTGVPKEKYPKEIIAFIPGFDGLAGNLDHTMEEAITQYSKDVTKAQPPQTQTQPR